MVERSPRSCQVAVIKHLATDEYDQSDGVTQGLAKDKQVVSDELGQTLAPRTCKAPVQRPGASRPLVVYVPPQP